MVTLQKSSHDFERVRVRVDDTSYTRFDLDLGAFPVNVWLTENVTHVREPIRGFTQKLNVVDVAFVEVCKWESLPVGMIPDCSVKLIRPGYRAVPVLRCSWVASHQR